MHSEVRLSYDEKARGVLIVDGIDLSEKVGADLTLQGQVGGPPILTVHLMPHLFDYEGPAEIKLSEETEQFLSRLGWISPDYPKVAYKSGGMVSKP
jgi:hypothetical protein